MIKSKVLVVEDDEDIQNYWALVLGNRVIVLRATTLKVAEELFERNPDVALVVMDGCVPGRELNTLPLIAKIRRTFPGPMIATSTLYLPELLAAGCDYTEEIKPNVPKKVMEILGVF